MRTHRHSTRTFPRLRSVICAALAMLASSSAGCVFISPIQLGPPQLREVRAQSSGRFFERNKIAVIDIEGFMSNGRRMFSWLGATVADVKQRLKKAEADSRVVAVVLRINSPGGEVTAADILYREILDFKRRTQNRKPVLACLMDVAASGGYYVALGADRIVAHPTTVTGSVGVVMNLTNVEGLYDKIGLKPVTFKSGKMKDIGSGTRKMTEEERAILQTINDQLFERFRQTVRGRRPNISSRNLKLISDGRVLTAKQALDLGMIDDILYLDQAIELAKRMARVPDAHVVIYRSFSHVNQNIYALFRSSRGTDLALLHDALKALIAAADAPHHPFARPSGPFLYLWSPGQ